MCSAFWHREHTKLFIYSSSMRDRPGFFAQHIPNMRRIVSFTCKKSNSNEWKSIEPVVVHCSFKSLEPFEQTHNAKIKTTEEDERHRHTILCVMCYMYVMAHKETEWDPPHEFDTYIYIVQEKQFKVNFRFENSL